MKKQPSDQFEAFIKEKANQYMVYPSDEVWNRIDKYLRPKRYLTTIILGVLMIGISGGLVMMNTKEEKLIEAKPGQIAYTFIKKEPLKKSYSTLTSIIVTNKRGPKEDLLPITKLETNIHNNIADNGEDNQSVVESFSRSGKVELPESILQSQKKATNILNSKLSSEKKNFFLSSIESIIAKAKIIGKNAQWQFYITPSMSFRKLDGKASPSAYQYGPFPYSTNSLFARDVNDAVKQYPDIGFEIGTAMFYPLSKRLSLKTGLQLNYNHYQIEAYNDFPVLATYGMNNYGFGGTTPISTVSIYSNTDGFGKRNLKNEHIMVSLPLGIDYVVAGDKNFNVSIGSTIQPSYLIGDNAYLISTNLKNYAKEPSLNRRWNINTAIEANLNFQSGSYKWSIGPQYRYQLMSSFKNKYPIKENLFDLGLKVGLIKTIR